MIDSVNRDAIEQVINNTRDLLELLKELANTNPSSERYLSLKKEFNALYEKTNAEHERLIEKPEVQTFMNELNLNDVDNDCKQMPVVRYEYQLLNNIQDNISPNLSNEKKQVFEQDLAGIFSKVNDFSDQKQLDTLRVNVETLVKPLMTSFSDKKETVKAVMADIANINQIKEISMGQSVDLMGGPKLSLGTGQRFQGVLGEIKESLQLLRNSGDSNDNKNKYFTKFTDSAASNILGFVHTQAQRNNISPTPDRKG